MATTVLVRQAKGRGEGELTRGKIKKRQPSIRTIPSGTNSGINMMVKLFVMVFFSQRKDECEKEKDNIMSISVKKTCLLFFFRPGFPY